MKKNMSINKIVIEWGKFLKNKEKIDRLKKEKYKERENYMEGYEDCAKELLGEDEAKKFLVGKKNF